MTGAKNKESRDSIMSSLKSEEFQKLLQEQIDASLEKMWEKFEMKIDAMMKLHKEDMTKVMNSHMKDMNELNTKINKLETDIMEKDSTIIKMEEKLDDYEQYSRRNCLIITGLDISGLDESMAEHKFMNLMFKMELDHLITPNSIERIHPIGKKVDKKCIVKFVSYKERRILYESRMFTPNGVYINESLTKVRNDLLYKCRQLKKNGKIKGCWSNDGVIQVKFNNGLKTTVKNKNDFDLINRENVGQVIEETTLRVIGE